MQLSNKIYVCIYNFLLLSIMYFILALPQTLQMHLPFLNDILHGSCFGMRMRIPIVGVPA